VADVPLLKVSPDWLFAALPGSQITAKFVATTIVPQIIGSDDNLRQKLGFTSLSQASGLAVPDPPFAVFRVGLSRLKGFNPEASPLKVLLENENWFENSPQTFVPVRYLFPIRELLRPEAGCPSPSLIDIPLLGCVSSSVQVKLLTGSWQFQQIGRPGLIKKLNQFGNGITHFVVWIPVLNIHYLAWLHTSGLRIKAIEQDRYVKNPRTGQWLAAGEDVSARDVFTQLKAVVQNIDPNGPPG
jgi:hypothetical protein